MKILLTILALIYVLSPYDILPDFIFGWGWLDDLIFLGFLWRYFYSAKKKGLGSQWFHRTDQQFYRNQNQERFSDGKTSGTYSQSREKTTAQDPYAVLEIRQGASPEDIKQAYRKLANKYHPDKLQHLGEEFKELAEKRFKEIDQAYRTLMHK